VARAQQAERSCRRRALEETEMSRLGQTWLALSLSAAAALPARAQVTLEMTKITCEQYILFAMGDPKDIAMWLNGYYSGKRNNTSFDVQEFRDGSKKLLDYCQLNLKTTVMDAAEKVLGVKR
jgi:acid stress chaperone HdeB